MHNVGIIGLGIMGQRMLRAMTAHPHFNVSQIWDVNSELTKHSSREYPHAVPSADAASLIENNDVELVYIATPPSTHIEYARMAIDADKAVFCEKPLAIDLADSRRLVAEVKENGVPNAINFPFAADLNIQTLEEDLEKKLHGKSERLEIRFHFNAWPRTWQSGAASWLAGRVEGGFLREVFSHFAYLTHRLIGPMEIETARVRFPADSNSAECETSAKFTANGVPVTLWGAVGGAAPDYNEWTLYGTERSYRLQDWGQLKVANHNRWYDVMPRGEPKPYLFHQLDNLSNMLTEENHLLPTFEDGLRVQEIVEGLLERTE